MRGSFFIFLFFWKMKLTQEEFPGHRSKFERVAITTTTTTTITTTTTHSLHAHLNRETPSDLSLKSFHIFTNEWRSINLQKNLLSICSCRWCTKKGEDESVQLLQEANDCINYFCACHDEPLSNGQNTALILTSFFNKSSRGKVNRLQICLPGVWMCGCMYVHVCMYVDTCVYHFSHASNNSILSKMTGMEGDRGRASGTMAHIKRRNKFRE